MRGEWVKVYDLAEDQAEIAAIQRATLHSNEFGLAPDIALFGSPEWWKAIDQGYIKAQGVSGIISKIYMTGHGDWPQFEIDSGGVKTRWTRIGNQALYKEGSAVRVEYVMQHPKKVRMGISEIKKVLRIFIAEPPVS